MSWISVNQEIKIHGKGARCVFSNAHELGALTQNPKT